jgi:hypothetical protein
MKYRNIAMVVVSLAISILWTGGGAELQAQNPGDALPDCQFMNCTNTGCNVDCRNLEKEGKDFPPTPSDGWSCDCDEETYQCHCVFDSIIDVIDVDMQVDACVNPDDLPIDLTENANEAVDEDEGRYIAVTIKPLDEEEEDEEILINTFDPDSFSCSIYEDDSDNLLVDSLKPTMWLMWGHAEDDGGLILYFHLTNEELTGLQAVEEGTMLLKLEGVDLSEKLIAGETLLDGSDFECTPDDL